MSGESVSPGANNREQSARGRSTGLVLFLAVLTVGYLAYAADRYVLTSLLVPIQKTLDLTGLQVGILGSAIYIGVLITVFLAGHLSDRYGKWKIVLLGLAIFTAFTSLIGLSTSFAEVFVFRLISGLGEGLFWPVAMAAVAAQFSSRKGLALGLFYVGFDAGGVVGTSTAGTIYYLVGTWEPAFFVAPLIGAVAIAGVLIARTSFDWTGTDTQRITLGRDALRLAKERRMIAVELFALLATWATVWQPVFLVYYFNQVLNLSVPYSAFLATPVLVSGAIGKVVLGGASDKWRRDRLLVLTTFLTLLSYAGFFSSTDLAFSILYALSMGFFSSAIFPIMQSIAADSSGGRVGTALGLTTTWQSVATILAPSTTGAMFALGIGRAVALQAMIPAVLTLVAAFLLKDPRIEFKLHADSETNSF